MPESSKIFQRNRALGYVSNHIPLIVRYIKCRKENLVVTCVGKSFHTYGCSRFTLLSVSSLHSDDITCLSGDTYHIYTTCGNIIYAWRRGTELKHTYVGHSNPIHLLMPFGPHLLSVDESNKLMVWDIKSEELHLELYFNNATFQISAIMHPSTYLNKILLGSDKGSMELWNIATSKLIYTFLGWGSRVTVLEQAPAIDVVAVGLSNGKIVLHNLKYDETVMEFMQDWGCVTSLSFRTDGHAMMASGSLMGHIVFWNLEERKVMSQLLAAHDKAVSAIQCLPNEPLMVTSSPDNSLKMWIFDMLDGGARLLKLREGHSAPPTFVRFHGSNGHNLLSSGHDSSLRIFSTITETFNKSLGRASYNRKLSKKKGNKVEDPLRMPPILKFTSGTTREKEWDNIAALHEDIPMVTTWSYDKLKMGEHKLVPERFMSRSVHQHVSATCICLTNCGNFVIIGYNTGHVDKFNIQSGLHRGSYGNPAAHEKSVQGVATDGLNQLTITGAIDGMVKFWSFNSPGSGPLSKLCLDNSVLLFCSHRESSMLAVALEDYSVSMIDVDTQTVVRKFVGHLSHILDATFSPDSRWLITADMDGVIRTWDIPSSQLIDYFQVDAVCTSLSFSPTGDMLATTHANYLGIFLWSNRTLYSHVSLRPLSATSNIPLLELPTSLGTSVQDGEDTIEGLNELEFKSPDQINDELITLSLLSNSRWQNLLNIDIVKKRNKPKEAPKAPKAAPFFLPTLASLELQFDLSAVTPTEDISKSIVPSSLQSLTLFGRLLMDSIETSGFQSCINKLTSLGPSAIDVEIQSLSPEGGGSIKLMLQFMKLIEFMLRSNNNFELSQAYLGLFLKTHGDTIASEPQLKEHIASLHQCQLNGWHTLQDKLLYCLSVVQALKTM